MEPGSLSGEEEPTRLGDGRPEARKKALTRDRAVGSFTPDHPAPRTMVRNEPERPQLVASVTGQPGTPPCHSRCPPTRDETRGTAQLCTHAFTTALTNAGAEVWPIHTTGR